MELVINIEELEENTPVQLEFDFGPLDTYLKPLGYTGDEPEITIEE